jgi:hypothetical protein
MHLGRARIGEADVNTARDKGPHQTFRTVHSFHSRSQAGIFRQVSSDRYRDLAMINHCSRPSSKGLAYATGRSHAGVACEIALAMACLATDQRFREEEEK